MLRNIQKGLGPGLILWYDQIFPGVDGRILLRWIFRKWDVGACTGWVCLRIAAGGGLV